MCVGTSTYSYTSKWANIKGQRGDLDLTIVEIGGSVSKVVVNSVPLVLQTVQWCPAIAFMFVAMTMLDTFTT